MSNMPRVSIPAVVGQKPVQAGKFVGILITLVLGAGGFLRLIDPAVLVDGHPIGDSFSR